MGGLFGNYFFVADAAVLALAAAGGVVLPTKMETLKTQLVADGLSLAAPLELKEFHDGAEAVVAGLDLNNLPAAYLLTVGDFYPTEGFGAGPAWLRAGLVEALCAPVHAAGLFRTVALGSYYFFAPGLFFSATRDAVGTPHRALMSIGQMAAAAAGDPFADPALSFPGASADAALRAFTSAAPPRGWSVIVDPDMPGLHRRAPGLTARFALASAAGCDAGTAQRFREALGYYFPQFATAVPTLSLRR